MALLTLAIASFLGSVFMLVVAAAAVNHTTAAGMIFVIGYALWLLVASIALAAWYAFGQSGRRKC